MEVISRSALVAFWNCRLAPTPRVLPDGTEVSRGGQPRTTLSVEGLLVGMLLVAVYRKAMHLTEFTKMIHHRISPVMRAELGVLRTRPPPCGRNATPSNRSTSCSTRCSPRSTRRPCARTSSRRRRSFT